MVFESLPSVFITFEKLIDFDEEFKAMLKQKRLKKFVKAKAVPVYISNSGFTKSLT